MLSHIFKAYDVRGTVPGNLNEEVAYKIGKAFVTLVGSKEIIIGHDMRPSSPKLVSAFCKGVTDMGASVMVIGEVCTDATYFAAGKFNLPAVMFTASHNPPGYNGMKFSRAGAVPINQDTGLEEMKRIIESESYKAVSDEVGTVREQNVLEEYVSHVKKFVDVGSLRKLRIAVDAGNGMAGKIIPLIYDDLVIEIVPLYFELDGTFPNHLADPSKFENLVDLQKKVVEEKCDFGMAFDGDADRIFFVDEEGSVVMSSLMSAMIAKNLLSKNPDSTIIHNVVCGHIVPDTVRENGGKVVVERVGHSFIKETMREKNALFGCEHSAHYYYRDNFNADSGMITSLIVSEIMSETDKTMSELISAFKKYHTIEETNSQVEDKDAKIAELKEKYSALNPKRVSEMDGITIEFDEWWFNVRPSNTEPLLRLNLEANTEKLMNEKKEEVLGIIRS